MKSAEERINELSWCLISKGKPCGHCQGCIISDDVKEVHLEILKEAKEELQLMAVEHDNTGIWFVNVEHMLKILGKFEDKKQVKA